MWSKHYGTDVLAAGSELRRRRFLGPGQREVPKVQAERGLVVEDAAGNELSRFCGAVVGYEKGAVTLEDRHGKRRVFPLAPAAFLLEGQPVTLIVGEEEFLVDRAVRDLIAAARKVQREKK